MVKLDDSHMTATTPAGILSLLFDSLGFFVSPFGIDLVNPFFFLVDTLLVHCRVERTSYTLSATPEISWADLKDFPTAHAVLRKPEF